MLWDMLKVVFILEVNIKKNIEKPHEMKFKTTNRVNFSFFYKEKT